MTRLNDRIAIPDAPAATPSRRSLLKAAAAGAALAAGPDIALAAQGSAAIRPFRIAVPQADLDDLRRRIQATRWPERETVADQSQGVQLAAIQPLVQYWGTGYDWRRAEAKLNALPQFITEIDGLEIQFAHIRSPHPDAMPLIMTHGWPGSIFEMLKVAGPLTDPTAHGGRAEDAFHLVLPTLPGYGFSGKPETNDWHPPKVAQAWHELMLRLGYDRYVAQGGDWGAVVSHLMAVMAPEGLAGIHTNMPLTAPAGLEDLIRNRQPAPAGLTPEEKAAYARMDLFHNKGLGYAELMGTRPQTIGYALTDSPAGMAAFFYDKFATWTDSGGRPETVLTRDEMLDAISFYWLTNTGASSSRCYWTAAQLFRLGFTAVEIPKTPVAVSVFPGELYPAPRSWAERAFKNLIYFNALDRGGHFAAWEQPALFTAELRAAFRPLR